MAVPCREAASDAQVSAPGIVYDVCKNAADMGTDEILQVIAAIRGGVLMKENGSIILTGFMGSGKSSLGVRLSYRMKLPLLDTDKWIEKEQGCSVAEIFARDGEEAFRKMETQALWTILNMGGVRIISTGGGLPMREEKRALLAQLGSVVFLRVKPETVCERLKGDTTRPLLRKEDPEGEIRRLLTVRNPLYEEAAMVTVDVDGKDYEQIMEEILRQV